MQCGDEFLMFRYVLAVCNASAAGRKSLFVRGFNLRYLSTSRVRFTRCFTLCHCFVCILTLATISISSENHIHHHKHCVPSR